ncbi:MAG: hypothetical protein Q9157_005744 [Trypethelium eluteriae]
MVDNLEWLLNSYEPFIHIIDSMIEQHSKWLEKCNEVKWRVRSASLNASIVWRQDHNDFTQQDPGSLNVVVNKSPEVVQIYRPPDANCLFLVMNYCLSPSTMSHRSQQAELPAPGQRQNYITGYKEKRNIDTPRGLALRNEADQCSMTMVAINRQRKGLGDRMASLKEQLRDQQIASKNETYETEIDLQEIIDWKWSFWGRRQ